MKFAKKSLLMLILFCTFFVSVNSFAGDPFEKLGRGVANIAFCWGELLMKPYDVNKDKGAIAAVTYGVFKGIGFTVARVCVGVVDIVTFPMMLPNCPDDPNDSGWGYGPMMRPPWVFDIEHNPYNFFYDDTAIAE